MRQKHWAQVQQSLIRQYHCRFFATPRGISSRLTPPDPHSLWYRTGWVTFDSFGMEWASTTELCNVIRYMEKHR